MAHDFEYPSDNRLVLCHGKGLKKLVFHSISIAFGTDTFIDVFARKNNKTLRETLMHRRYRKLENCTKERYPENMNDPLGCFLIDLKRSGDGFYKRFLNSHGDLKYSCFHVEDAEFSTCKGVYAFFLKNQPVYIERCLDSIKKRIDQGYGRIAPKNCYIDGQATNCRVNSRVTTARQPVSFWLHPMESRNRIQSLEHDLITQFVPKWNIQRQ